MPPIVRGASVPSVSFGFLVVSLLGSLQSTLEVCVHSFTCRVVEWGNEWERSGGWRGGVEGAAKAEERGGQDGG